MIIPFGVGAYQGRSRDVNYQRCLNVYPEITEENAKTKIVGYGTPGLKLLASPLSGGGCRSNGIVFKGNLYFVIGPSLVRLDRFFDVTIVGTLNSHLGRCDMSQNAVELMVVDGPDGYTWDGTTFAQIDDLDYPGGTHTSNFDSFSVVNIPGTQQFAISKIADSRVWDALDFASAERHPDKLMAIIANRRELWLLGEYTTEAFYNDGNRIFPFSPISNAFIEWGINAPHSVQKFDNGIIWLGQTERGGVFVVRSQGYSARVVSQRWLEEEFNGYVTEDAEAYVYQQAGHEFYVLNFPTQNKTWCYDAVTKRWHERGAYGVGRQLVNGHGYFNGRNIGCDFRNGKIYEIDLDVYTDNGEHIERIANSPPISDENKYLFWPSLELDFEEGVGITEGQGSDPQVMLRISRDGGHVFNYEKTRSMGKIGEYGTRCIFRKIPRTREFVAEIRVSDPVKFVCLGAYANPKKGRF